MPSNVIVDTNIWHFALVEPREKGYKDIHLAANDFLEGLLSDPDVRIFLSAYQAGEIIEVLRKSGVDVEVRSNLINDFATGKFFVKDLLFDHVLECLKDSSSSGIHVYDYLVAYPLRGLVNRIYSADDHLLHKDFNFAEAVNPLSPWILREGQRPHKQT